MKWLSLLVVLFPIIARAACVPANAPTGSIGCQPAATSPAITDYVEAWQPGRFPGSATIMSLSQLLAAITSGDVGVGGSLSVTGTAALNLGLGAFPLSSSIGYLDATIEPGVDPTGATDSTAGIRAALATGKAVHLPCGTYHITNTLTVGAGGAQRDHGDGACTILTVGSDFNPSATSIINLEGVSDALVANNAQIDNLVISFAQPPDVVTTASEAGSGSTVTVASTANIVAGNYIYDATTHANISNQTTVSSISGNTLTLSASAASIASGDSLHFGPSRAQFKTLAQGCTTGLGGTGCKYPWAIYANGYSSEVIRDIVIESAWDGIDLYNSPTSKIDTVDVGALDNGLLIDDTSDAVYVDKYKFNAYGFWGTVLENETMADGDTECMTPGRSDGGHYTGADCFLGKAVLLTSFTWATMTDLSMDGQTATFTVPTGLPTNSYLMLGNSHMENVGASSDGCILSVGSGQVIAGNLRLNATGTNDGADLCVTGGVLAWSGGYLIQNTTNQPMVLQSGGEMNLAGALLQPATGTSSVSPIQISGGVYHVIGNTIDGPISISVPVIDVTASYTSGDAIASNSIPDGGSIAYNGSAGFTWPNADTVSQGNQTVGLLTTDIAPASVTATSGATLTAANLQSGYLTRSGPTDAFTDTTDTAHNLVLTTVTHPTVGQSWKVRIINTTAYTQTISGGTNVTMSGTSTIAGGDWRDFVISLTNVTGGTYAATMTSVGSGAN